uniref:Katanin p80 subunit C-terminal domain-containing protein n=1 Tax=Daucus carota subsp. sativus TaxID=79200 RepID=A0A164SN84_DAUCS
MSQLTLHLCRSLSGHSSGIDSVCFDSSEVFVAAGAASGTIKLWNLEEAKIVRTLPGHRSNCISLDFHPFGEIFASGSSDTNLKIWDIRLKGGCIHTYKGHTRGVNAIRFTPDGRWVVSGGEDNTVKLWDLTAGKLLHEFKSHEGQIQCIDFHPNEYLLATGSADKTVKFWDLETFEFIGSAGPEATGVQCMTFNPDGKNLLCGLHESLKVFSWEPIRCHDTVDVGWSRLSDINVHEGKLLGCSYNHSCVGVWVVDISCVEPYAIVNTPRSNSISGPKANLSRSVSQTENTAKTSTARQQNSNLINKESKSFPYVTRAHRKDQDTSAMESQRAATTRSLPTNWEKKDRSPGHKGFASSNLSGAVSSVNTLPNVRLYENMQDFFLIDQHFPFLHLYVILGMLAIIGISFLKSVALSFNFNIRGTSLSTEKEMEPVNEEDTISALTEQHKKFVGSLQSRLAKLEMVQKYWERNDIKGAIGMTEKMSDNAVLADIVSILAEKPDIVTLDICTCVLPLLTSLLESEIDQYE